jgi:hypothetical protein
MVVTSELRRTPEFLGQTSLADAGFPGTRDQSSVTSQGTVEQRFHATQLGIAADDTIGQSAHTPALAPR